MKGKISNLKNVAVKGAKNIGPTIAGRLHDIGVFTLADLREMGPAKAFLKIKEKNPGKNISVCYYLYSFEGALLDLHWDDIPERRKKQLLTQVGK